MRIGSFKCPSIIDALFFVSHNERKACLPTSQNAVWLLEGRPLVAIESLVLAKQQPYAKPNKAKTGFPHMAIGGVENPCIYDMVKVRTVNRYQSLQSRSVVKHLFFQQYPLLKRCPSEKPV